MRFYTKQHKALSRVETKHGPGKAWPVLAPPLARAVYARCRRQTACELEAVAPA